ncbi:hypothetical protein EVAR_64618_1 [Eumeta japonica]|uniref:Uncharacterized protein n=1 Tax=Eumeta variegata TaxID=151549 RepID=A0A4C1Z9P3_EUMVA|nr:hypothetical protein EVAR_64618_1 [Eumeta japonica]
MISIDSQQAYAFEYILCSRTSYYRKPERYVGGGGQAGNTVARLSNGRPATPRLCYRFRCAAAARAHLFDTLAAIQVGKQGRIKPLRRERVVVCNCKVSGRAMLCPGWLQHTNGPARPVRYHVLTVYKREVAASSVAFRLVKTSSNRLPKRVATHLRLRWRYECQWVAVATYSQVAQ